MTFYIALPISARCARPKSSTSHPSLVEWAMLNDEQVNGTVAVIGAGHELVKAVDAKHTSASDDEKWLAAEDHVVYLIAPG